MKIGRFVAILVVCCSASFSTAGASSTSPGEASKFLDTLASYALNILRSSELSLEAREAKVRGLLAENFDIPRIGRFVLGKSWRGASDEQKKEYQRLFGQFLTQVYAKRLGGYTGEAFKIVKANAYGKKDALVLTEIARPSGPPLKAGWRVRNGSGGLKILDVMVEGVSMAATQRSEFESVVKSHGVDGLLEMLRLKVDKYSARGS
ncbi:MAG: ABC transporter substrate-binding protein [Alphaproteobacteria bacterium]|jgi:phospholipid transport system substrate-binding protein|nr:ABC transporter substrate-binding protein [Alphaproteobacteria bacterium]